MEIWHNPRCSKSRETLGILTDAGVDPTVRRYLDDPPDAEELARVLDLLGLAPWDVTRFGEQVAKDLGLKDRPREDPAAWIDLLVANPRLIERPIVVDGDRAVVGRPPENVHTLLA
ncbi:arsenate reductase (glutaredoxin) [Salsipaludibacter albus]|uniref:arsenate reductase (glutaredoxin) n=1 Tax=Salsipaludibacter albus TaxID=2849650 RepID=UPI001EE4DF01|nr:arsenate reductase (glutaredoxin) [Salsipaludibacter albus]MBY5162326.1 arsenate reductase (glutaredoxin) [Salsipaludibacter albus]